MMSRTDSLRERFLHHPGRGGCGVGALANLDGRPSHDLLEVALNGLRCMEHRGVIDDTGDGAGVLLSLEDGKRTTPAATGVASVKTPCASLAAFLDKLSKFAA